MPVTYSWFGHTTLIREKLADISAEPALSETLTDTDVHFKLATEVDLIPVYRKFGNVAAYLFFSGLGSSFAVSGSNAPIASAGTAFRLVTYLLDKDTMLERPVFNYTSYLNEGIILGRTYSIDGELSTKLNHYNQIPVTSEYYTTAYDPIDDVTFTIKYPGLICKIGFAWVYGAWSTPSCPITLSASALLSGRVDLLSPA